MSVGSLVDGVSVCRTALQIHSWSLTETSSCLEEKETQSWLLICLCTVVDHFSGDRRDRRVVRFSNICTLTESTTNRNACLQLLKPGGGKLHSHILEILFLQIGVTQSFFSHLPLLLSQAHRLEASVGRWVGLQVGVKVKVFMSSQSPLAPDDSG